jgi:hypothetical protein
MNYIVKLSILSHPILSQERKVRIYKKNLHLDILPVFSLPPSTSPATRATFTTPPNIIPLYTVIQNLKSTPKKKIGGVGSS